MDERTRRLERSLRSGEFDKDVFDAYMAAMARQGVEMCHCENSGCEKVHVYDPRYGPRPGDTHIDDESTNVGFCINQVDPNVKVEYVQMCDDCAQQLPKEWHLDDCECTLCGPNVVESPQGQSPQGQIAGMLDDNGDFISDEEPDPTEHGWHEDWESDEFEDEDLDHRRNDY